MENNKLLLTKQEAMEVLPIGRRGFESLIKNGEIGYKKVNGRYFFTVAEINRWVNDLEHHTAYTPEARPCGHTLRRTPKTEKRYSLDALAEQMYSKRQSNSATRNLQSYKMKQSVKPQVSFQV